MCDEAPDCDKPALQGNHDNMADRPAIADGSAFRRGPVDRVSDRQELRDFLADENIG